jgi:hypothetical protein
MRHIDIVGLSLAELSLALIFVVLALPPPGSDSSHSQAAAAIRQAGQLNLQLAGANRQIAELQAEKYRLQGRVDAFNASRPNLRSVALPSCAEIKLTSDWLFTAAIQGQDRYEVEGVGTVTIAQILERFHNEMEEGRIHGCVQRVRVRVGKNISAEDYDFALRRLEQYFYPKKLGSAP